MQGNRRVQLYARLRPGSIPADAGQPTNRAVHQVGAGVYPRGCGATVLGYYEHNGHLGLSPRMRGNLAQAVAFSGVSGSIPADAGQPIGDYDRESTGGVYPRGCGATRPVNVG